MGLHIAKAGVFERLRGARRVFIAGAGGGFDVYCGTPIYLAPREQGKENLSQNLFPDQSRARKQAVSQGPLPDGRGFHERLDVKGRWTAMLPFVLTTLGTA